MQLKISVYSSIGAGQSWKEKIYFVIDLSLRESIKSVSYTHLDVYKRQSLVSELKLGNIANTPIEPVKVLG